MAGLAPGTIVDSRYKIVSRLGAGGMADVFLAEDEQLGRKVALKLLYQRFAEDPGFVERFRREAQAAAGLQHPNVVSVYDRGSYDGTYYIAMEYLPGRSLKQLIRQEAPLDPVRAIDITIQILKAARFAHRRGVIHRDLKPHNVIVDDADNAKVTDFGIARAGASDMTETGSIMGTAQYLSPEQAQGHAVSAGSDLYSIAVVLYEMLTGPGAVRCRVGGDDRAQARVRGAAAADDRQLERPARARAGRDVGAEQEPRRPPGERRSVHHGARAGQGGDPVRRAWSANGEHAGAGRRRGRQVRARGRAHGTAGGTPSGARGHARRRRRRTVPRGRGAAGAPARLAVDRAAGVGAAARRRRRGGVPADAPGQARRPRRDRASSSPSRRRSSRTPASP